MFAAEDLAYEDNTEGEVASPTGDYLLTPEEEAAAAADPELDLDLEEVAAPVADALPIP